MSIGKIDPLKRRARKIDDPALISIYRAQRWTRLARPTGRLAVPALDVAPEEIAEPIENRPNDALWRAVELNRSEVVVARRTEKIGA